MYKCPSPFLSSSLSHTLLHTLLRLPNAVCQCTNMADVALQIPHILTTITDPLSFSDLISFILVCRKWHGIFIPILWADSVTFRSIDSSQG